MPPMPLPSLFLVGGIGFEMLCSGCYVFLSDNKKYTH
jgi:hypothetical protein